MNLVHDESGFRVQGFAPNRGATYTGTVTVTEVTAIRFGSDVTISISGKSLSYSAQDGIVMIPGVTYTFGSSVDCHVMD